MTEKIVHPELVAALVKPGEDILKELTPITCHLWHMASCIPSEAGELFDAVKRHVLYGARLDMDNIVEELGDLEFYMEGVRAALGITREQCLKANIEKLLERYHEMKFQNLHAQERVDKA